MLFVWFVPDERETCVVVVLVPPVVLTAPKSVDVFVLGVCVRSMEVVLDDAAVREEVLVAR